MKNHSAITLLGIDIGTTGTKCTLYNKDSNIIAQAYTEYPMIHPRPEWTEQNPDVWWQATCSNLKQIFADKKINPAEIAAIGLSCTNAITIVDKNGIPLYNAIGHQDKRADKEVEWLKKNIGNDLIESHCNNQLAKGSFSLPSIKWFFNHFPKLSTKAYKILMPSGYIIYKLTGIFSMNIPRMSLTLLGNIHTEQWDAEIANKAGIPARILPPLYEPTDIVGVVTETAAKITGLTAGTPVCAGCLDTVVSTLASGAVNVNDMAITIGSSARICYISDQLPLNHKLLTTRSPYKGLYTIIQSTDNAGVSLRWFRDVFGRAIESDARTRGWSIYDYMDYMAAQVYPGSGGLIYLPYLNGEKAPIWNSKAKGVFFGISLDTTYATFIRAIMEGVAFSIKHCLEEFPKSNPSNAPIPIGGGGAQSQIWCQIISDVLNLPVIQLKTSETETLGDMIIAAQSVGIKEITNEYGKELASHGALIVPNIDNAKLYNRQYQKYKNIYIHLKDDFDT